MTTGQEFEGSRRHAIGLSFYHREKTAFKIIIIPFLRKGIFNAFFVVKETYIHILKNLIGIIPVTEIQ